MKLSASLTFATLLATALITPAQNSLFTDPANLRGERVRPTDGRELPIDQGSRGLEQMLRRLNTRASLMLIIAHPDDEDGGLLTFYSRGLGGRVGMLTLNRGEGGQNAVTGDFEDALGLLRTQELLSADRYLGVDQMFGTEVDFGFSKTKEEAFGKWGHQRVLYDAVRAVRLYRPLVVASVFVGGVTDGHGQHQVSGEIAQEVFKAAGDPSIFPELTREGIYPWQPLKVYARVPAQAITPQGLFDYATGQYTPARFTNYVTGEVTTTPPSPDVIVHEGKEDPLLRDPGASGPLENTRTGGQHVDPVQSTGTHSYVQFARLGLGLQKSQIGPGVRAAPPGAFDITYHLYGSCLGGSPSQKFCHFDRGAATPLPLISKRSSKPSPPDFFSDIDTSFTSIASLAPSAPTSLALGLEQLGRSIAAATAAFSPANPSAIAPGLADALRQTDTLLATLEKAHFGADQKDSVLHELRIKRVQLNQALVLALGLQLTATVEKADFPIHEALTGAAHLTESSSASLGSASIHSLADPRTGAARDAGTGGNGSILSSSHPLDAPCGLSPDQTVLATRPYFHRDSPEQAVYTLTNPALRNAPATPPALICVAQLAYSGVPVTLAAVATHAGQPVSLVPPISVALAAHAQVLPASEPTASVSAEISSNTPALSGTLTLRSSDGWTPAPASAPLQAGTTAIMLTPPQAKARPSALLQATAVTPQASYTESYRPVGYPGLPRTNIYTPAKDRIVPVDLGVPKNLRLAYLPGTGDSVPEALASIGIRATTLTVADLNAERLAQFDTVVLGVRAYNAHPDLHGAPTQALLAFARGGGNVVLQYQTAEFTGADAPFPLTLGRDAEKVVDEAAGVQLLDADSPLLSSPNRITPSDFSGWIEERGHGFLRTWDAQYAALTETHDPSQDPQRGGLITTPLGKGRWTYVAFAIYRQLPEAVPGSFRLFVNLLNPVH